MLSHSSSHHAGSNSPRAESQRKTQQKRSHIHNQSKFLLYVLINGSGLLFPALWKEAQAQGQGTPYCTPNQNVPKGTHIYTGMDDARYIYCNDHHRARTLPPKLKNNCNPRDIGTSITHTLVSRIYIPGMYVVCANHAWSHGNHTSNHTTPHHHLPIKKPPKQQTTLTWPLFHTKQTRTPAASSTKIHHMAQQAVKLQVRLSRRPSTSSRARRPYSKPPHTKYNSI